MPNEKVARFPMRHRRILSLYKKGLPAKDIATQVGIHVATVYDIMKTKRFVEEVEKVEQNVLEEISEIFKQNAHIAADAIVQMSQKGHKAGDRLQFEAAKEVLYQIGAKPREVTETIKREYSIEEVKSAKETSSEVLDIISRLDNKRSRFLVSREVEQEVPPSEPAQLQNPPADASI